MVFPALALALASSSLLYVATPRMPLYRVTSMRPSSLPSISGPFSGMRFSATFRAGMEVTNANFVGADVHGADVDMFYPDWGNELRYIGNLMDFRSTASSGLKNGDLSKNVKAGEGSWSSGGFALASDPLNSEDRPILTVGPRGTANSDSDAMFVSMTDVNPSTYFNMLWDAASSYGGRGTIEVLSAGVLRVRSQSGPIKIPLSLSIICDNEIDLLSIPWRVTGKDCAIEGVFPGWDSAGEKKKRLREKVMKSYGELIGKLRHSGKEDSSGEGGAVVVNNSVMEWNDF